MPIYSSSDPEFYELITSTGMEWAHTGGAEIGWRVGAMAMRLDADDDSAPVVMIAELPPGASMPRHAHNAHRVEIQLKGSIISGDRVLLPGDVSISAPGEFYGPNTAGPEGSTSIEVISSVDGVVSILSEEGTTPEELAEIERTREIVARHRASSGQASA